MRERERSMRGGRGGIAGKMTGRIRDCGRENKRRRKDRGSGRRRREKSRGAGQRDGGRGRGKGEEEKTE